MRSAYILDNAFRIFCFKFIWDLAKKSHEFKLKLIAFKNQINESDYTFFPTLTAHAKKKKNEEQENDEEQEQGNDEDDMNDYEIDETPDYDNAIFVQLLDVLIQEFDTRFADFKKFDLAFKFLKNPFSFDEEKHKVCLIF